MSAENKKNITILGPEVGYTDLLDAEIKEKIQRDLETNNFYPLRPSSAGYSSRRLAFDLMEYEGKAKYEKEIISPATYRLLNLGHSIEYSALRNFELLKDFKLKYKQQSVTMFTLDATEAGVPGKLIEGSLDVVLWSDVYKCVIDVKSQKDGWSVAYRSRWDETCDKYNNMESLVRIGDSAWYADDLEALVEELGDDFFVDNLLQLNLYACSDFLVERGIDHASIYKYGKNDSRHYEVRFRPSMKLKEKIRSKFNDIIKAVAMDSPMNVPCECMLGSIRAAFCPYKRICWEEDTLKAFYKTMPKEWPTDLNRITGKHGKTLETQFNKLAKLIPKTNEREEVEAAIIKLMDENKIKKIRLDDGLVYELRYLKSPHPHFELRRGKA